MNKKTPSQLVLSSNLAQAIAQFTHWTEEAWFPHLGDNGMDAYNSDLFVMSLGLGGETGEVMEAVSENNPAKIAKELGDVAYYWGRLAGLHELDIKDIIEQAEKIEPKTSPIACVLDMGTKMSRIQDIIKKGVRDGGMDEVAFHQGMIAGLACWIHVAQAYEINPVEALQGSIDKIVKRHATGQLRGSDMEDGTRVNTAKRTNP